MCLTCLLTKYSQDNISPPVKVATVKMVDKFSFPSGHATRATMLALLFCSSNESKSQSEKLRKAKKVTAYEVVFSEL